jgi:hypothetical protein
MPGDVARSSLDQHPASLEDIGTGGEAQGMPGRLLHDHERLTGVAQPGQVGVELVDHDRGEPE